MGNASPQSDRDLLVALLQHADTSAVPTDLREQVIARIAEIGGCRFCGRPATRLCDFVIGRELSGWSDCTYLQAVLVGRTDEYVHGKGLPCAGGECFTCDMAMCDHCSVNPGILCGHGPGGAIFDTVDRCPLHDGETGIRARVMTAEQARMVRNQIHAREVAISPHRAEEV